MEGQLDFLNLDEELEVAIPEDSKAYLKQLGLEEYKWDQFTSGDPGLYWQDVPMENNPEAYLDVLSRESQRRRSTKSVSSTSSVAPDFSKAPGQAWKQRSSMRDSKRQSRTKPGAIPQQNAEHNGPDEHKSTKGLSKQVSFKERLVEEIPQQKREDETVTSTPKQRNKEHRRSNRDHEPNKRSKSKEKDHKDKSNTRSSSKDRARSASRDRLDKPKSSGKSGRSESVERDFKIDKNDGSNSPRKSKRFKMPDFKNLLPGKKPDKQKISVINAFDNKTRNTVIASDDDTDREGRSISCLSTGRSKHKYHEPSSTDVTSDESDFFRNSPNTVDLLTVCIDNEIPAHRYASQKPEKVTKLKRTSSLLSAVDGEKARSTHGSQGHLKIESGSPNSVSSVGSSSVPHSLQNMVAPPVTAVTTRGQNIIEIVSNEKGNGDASPRSQHDRPEDRLQGPLKFAYEGNLLKLKQHTCNMSNENILNLRDEYGNTVLHLAAARGNLDCSEYLCRRWQHLIQAENKAKLTPAASAIKEGQIECLDWLLDNLGMDEDVTSPRRKLLHWAAKFGQDGCLRLLLSRLDSRGRMDHASLLDQHLNSPAHMAAKYGHLTCLQTLVEFGVDVCSTNQYGHTPCYYADFGNHRHCAGYLMLVETVTHITKDLVNSKHRQSRLQEQVKALNGHLNECMELSQWWLGEHQDHEIETTQTQQLLEELAEAASDLSGKLEDVLLENCTLRQKINGAVQNAPLFRDDVKESLDHAASLCQQLDNLNIPHDHQVARQYILRVKDIQRKIESSSSRFETRSPPLDIQEQAALLMRQRIQEASQRLVVYRTSRDGKTPRRLDPGLMSPEGTLTSTHGSLHPMDQHVSQTRPHAARSLFGNSEPNLPVRMSASAMPLPSIPTTASNTHGSNNVTSTGPGSMGHASSFTSVSSLSNGSRSSNSFRPPSGGTAFREVGVWRSEPQINQPPGGTINIQKSSNKTATSHDSHSHSSFLNNMVSGKPIVSGVQKSQTGSAFVPIIPTKPAENHNNTKPVTQSPDKRSGVRTITSRNTGIHIHSSMPLNAILDSQKESSVDPDSSVKDAFNDPDKTPTPSPPPSRSYKSISSAISEVRRNIEEISKSRKLSPESLEPRFEKENKDERDASDTPMLSALEDSSSNHSGDPDPYTAEIPDPVLDESLVTKDGTPRHVAVKQSKAKLEFHKDFADKDIRTSSPVVLPTDVQTDSQVARLTRENVKRNENLYWSTQKHDFTDSFILEDDQSKSENISPKRVIKKPSPHHENIFAGFAPAMPDKLTDTREIPIQVNLSMQDFRDGYEQGLLGDLEGPALEEDEFDPYGLEPYQGGNGLYFDHSLSTIEEVSVISESTKADEDLQKDNSDSLQGSPNKTRESDARTVVDSDEDSPKSDKQQNTINISHTMNNMSLDGSRLDTADGNKAWYEDSDEEEAHHLVTTSSGGKGWDTTGNTTMDLSVPPSHPPPPPPGNGPPPPPAPPTTDDSTSSHFTIF